MQVAAAHPVAYDSDEETASVDEVGFVLHTIVCTSSHGQRLHQFPVGLSNSVVHLPAALLCRTQAAAMDSRIKLCHGRMALT